MATLTLASPWDTYDGILDIGDGESIQFSSGSAVVSQAEDRKAPFPRGGRMRRILQAIVNAFGGGIVQIDGVQPDSWFMAQYGYGMPDHK